MHVPGGAKGSDKLQVIGTPFDHCEHVYRFYGGPPDLDPFGMPGQVLRARRIAMLPEHWGQPLLFGPDVEVYWGNGYSILWTGKVYGNPPFEGLAEAFTHALEAAVAGAEVLLLVPLRTHRAYWEHAWAAQGICYLKRPVVFLGYDHGLPLPCCYLYFGDDFERFRATFAELGRVERLTRLPRPGTVPRMVTKRETQTPEGQAFYKHMGALLVDLIALNPTLTLAELARKHPEIDNPDMIWSMPVGELFGGRKAPAKAKANGKSNGVAKPIVAGPKKAPKKAAAPKKTAKKKTKTKAAAPKKTAKKKTKTKTAAPKKDAESVAAADIAAQAEQEARTAGAAAATAILEPEPAPEPFISAPDKLAAFLDTMKKGDSFITKAFIDTAKVSAQTARKCLNECTRVKKTGDKRTAKWKVVK